MAELADAHDSKSCGKPCGFEKMEEDKKLYRRFLNGDNESFEHIMNKYMEKIIYFIYKFIKSMDVAEDLAQDVFVYILMNKEKYDSKYSLKAYLYTIAKSKTLNYIKRENKITYLQDNDYLFNEEEIEDIIFDKEQSQNLKIAIDNLPEPQNQIIYLADIEELSYKEICNTLNMSLSQVKTLIYRGRRKLKKILMKEVNNYNG